MSELRLQDGMGGPTPSRLPEDPAYWDSLAHRVSQAAAPTLAEMAGGEGSESGWFAWLEPRAPLLAAGALVAAALAWLLLPSAAPTTRPAPAPQVVVARALAPDDPLLSGIATDAQPPVLARLIVPTGTRVQR